MSDNTILYPMSGGDKIQTEDMGANGKIQRIKIAMGLKGSDDGDVSSTTPLPVTMATGLKKTLDNVTTYPKGPTSVNLTASGQILAAPGQVIGFYVNSTSGGTVRISNALSATTPYMGGSITPAIGFHKFPCTLSVAGYVTISGTIDVTFFVILD